MLRDRGDFSPPAHELAIDTTAAAAWKNLALIQSDSMHVFIDDGYSYAQVSTSLLQGHKQVTDAWLAQLARRHGIRLATLDGGLVATHPDVGFLIPELGVPVPTSQS